MSMDSRLQLLVARLYQEFNKHSGGLWILPEDFGAVGDGVTSDKVALDNAAAASAARGVPVLIRYGKVYAVHTQMFLPEGAQFVGHGTIKAVPATTIPRILNIANYNSFKNVRLDGDDKVTSEVLKASNVIGFKMRGGKVLNTSGIGVNILGSSSSCTIRDVEVDYCSTGIRLYGDVRDFKGDNVRITHWGQRGWYVIGDGTSAPRDVWINGGKVTDLIEGEVSRYPVKVGAAPHSKNIKLTNIYVEGTDTAYDEATFVGTADQISVTYCDGLLIEGCTSLNGGEGGMTVSHEVKNARIIGNRIERSNGAALFLGSTGATNCENHAVQGNTMVDCGLNRTDAANPQDRGRCGVRVQNVVGANISGNLVRDTGVGVMRYGFSLADSTDVKIGTDNQILGMTISDILDETGNLNISTPRNLQPLFVNALEEIPPGTPVDTLIVVRS